MADKQNPPKSDFERLRLKYLKGKLLFEDQDFPAKDSTIYFSKQPDVPVTWMRPHEIMRAQNVAGKPHFLLNGTGSRFDIKQGFMGDCWVLAGMSVVCGFKDAFEWLVPTDQSFDPSWYAGIFRFRFWQYGKWIEVYVDDRLPTFNNGEEYFSVSSTSRKVFWACLLEKAYAKVHTSYEAIEAGFNGESLTDFTGGVVEQYNLSDIKNLRALLRKAFRSGAAVATDIISQDLKETMMKNGLGTGHAYSVTGFGEVTKSTGDKKQLLARIRNPWGTETEWNGTWSDSSIEWSTLTPESVEALKMIKKDDGEFWMSLSDFKWQFDGLTVCNFTPDSLVDGKLFNWKITTIHGVMEKQQVNEDNPAPSQEEIFKTMKQHLIKVRDYDDDNLATVIIQLIQKNVRQKKHLGQELVPAMFKLIKKPKKSSLPLSYDKVETAANDVVAKETSVSGREMTQRFDLDPGQYVLIPFKRDPTDECEYMFRIFSEAPYESNEV